jgi:CDP-diacylglycerol pyrophosphatase
MLVAGVQWARAITAVDVARLGCARAMVVAGIGWVSANSLVAATSPVAAPPMAAANTAGVATPLPAASPMRPPSDPNSLWRIVHEKCVPAQAGDGKPGPCELVDPQRRYVVLKDIRGDTRFLLLPTDPISGIESPALLQSGVPNYWQPAWAARQYVEARAGRAIPRELLGLTVNSVFQRTQNQLHIHIDCVNPALHEALVKHAEEFSERWPARPVVLVNRSYYVMKITTPDVGTDPFQQLAQRLSHPAADMGGQSLSLIGARFADGRPGFYLLDSPAGIHGGTSEDALDRSCAVLHASQHPE